MRKYLYLVLLSLLAFLIILAIYHYGDIPNKHKNGFKRSYFPAAWVKERQLDLPDTLSGIVGSTPSTIYVGTSTRGEILAISRDRANTVKRIKLPYFETFYDSLGFNSLSIIIDSPVIYLFAENKPAILKTTFDAALCEIRILPPGPFTREVMVGKDCFMLRKFEPKLTDQIFVRYNFSTGLLKKEKNISEIAGDGGIISDGQLYFDPSINKSVYVYFYKNLLLSFDTSLDFVNRFYSIDTISSFKMQTGLVKNGDTRAYTNISPANVVNKVNGVQDGLLFNMSALKADNETDAFFYNNSILDIIDLKNGQYLGSIYSPTINGNKLSKFILSDNELIGLYRHSLVIYTLNLSMLPKDQ
ncbi:MAG TPA: hypothetical protein VL832_11720 [Puia sp.]|nr:hypothetical protein [Puia sp.]